MSKRPEQIRPGRPGGETAHPSGLWGPLLWLDLIGSSDLPWAEKFVACALVRWANEYGVCWPSTATLAAFMSMSEPGVRRILKRLVAAEIVTLEVRSRGGRPHRLRLQRGALEKRRRTNDPNQGAGSNPNPGFGFNPNLGFGSGGARLALQPEPRMPPTRTPSTTNPNPGFGQHINQNTTEKTMNGAPPSAGAPGHGVFSADQRKRTERIEDLRRWTLGHTNPEFSAYAAEAWKGIDLVWAGSDLIAASGVLADEDLFGETADPWRALRTLYDAARVRLAETPSSVPPRSACPAPAPNRSVNSTRRSK